MADKTKTVVTFESHERTVVRRTRRTASVRRVQILVPSPERAAGKRLARLCAWWRDVALKGVAALAPLKRRLRSGGHGRSQGRP